MGINPILIQIRTVMLSGKSTICKSGFTEKDLSMAK